MVISAGRDSLGAYSNSHHSIIGMVAVVVVVGYCAACYTYLYTYRCCISLAHVLPLQNFWRGWADASPIIYNISGDP